MQLEQNITQEQKLILTQSLTMSIKILEMNSVELSEFLGKEILENPLLDGNVNDGYKASNDEVRKLKEDFKKEIYDIKETEYKQESDSITPFNYISQKKTLRDYLHEQLGEMKVDKNIRRICNYLIEDIDSRGYLPTNVDENLEKLSCSKEEVELAIKVIQSMEPSGVGSRSLEECLCIQLKKKKIYSEEMKTVIEKCLLDIANARYASVAKKAGISVAKAKEYIKIIKNLEPKPSRGYYTGEEVKYVIPDAEIYKEDNKLNIKIFDEIIPEIKINDEYRKLMSSTLKHDEKDYIDKKIERARNILTGVKKREDTMLKILNYILENQNEYFKYGKDKLKPMSIKQMAEDLRLSDSTISRAVKGKYIYTPNGVESIRNLFTSSLNQGNVNVSVDVVKSKIKKIIEEEDKNKPFSDKVICDMLNNMKIKVSRRTVAKYREELGIESSSKRRKI